MKCWNLGISLQQLKAKYKQTPPLPPKKGLFFIFFELNIDLIEFYLFFLVRKAGQLSNVKQELREAAQQLDTNQNLSNQLFKAEIDSLV